jgi:hypothetical protein
MKRAGAMPSTAGTGATLKTYVYPHIGALPAQAIDTALAMRVLQQRLDATTFWQARPETASRVRGRCEQIRDAAKAQKLCGGENPFEWKTLKHLLPAKTKIHKVEHHPPCLTARCRR